MESTVEFTYNGKETKIYYFANRNNKLSQIAQNGELNWDDLWSMVDNGILTYKELGVNTYNDCVFYVDLEQVAKTQ